MQNAFSALFLGVTNHKKILREKEKTDKRENSVKPRTHSLAFGPASLLKFHRKDDAMRNFSQILSYIYDYTR